MSDIKLSDRMELVSISMLKPYEKNAKKHPPEQIDKIAKSIKRFGFASPILIDESGFIIAGHGRYFAAKQLGICEIPCVLISHLNQEEKRAYIIADNKLGETGWINDLLIEEVKALNEFGFELGDIGFESDEIDQLLSGNDNDTFGEDDHVPEAPAVSITKKGDLWILGKNKLLCGDSTSAKDYYRIMDGRQADIVITDPPYNVNYTGKTSDALKIQNDSITNDEFAIFLTSAFKRMSENIAPGGSAYIFHADSSGEIFRSTFKSSGFMLKQVLIWVKDRFVLGRQDYHWQHEPILYGWKEGAPHNWTGDRTQSTIIDHQPDFKSMKKEELLSIILALSENTTAIREQKPSRNAEHPTMKPVNLIARLLKNSSQRGNIALDPFGGSGSTLIACEKNDRINYTIEIDEKYCDVIVQRLEDFTGKKAQRIKK